MLNVLLFTERTGRHQVIGPTYYIVVPLPLSRCAGALCRRVHSTGNIMLMNGIAT